MELEVHQCRHPILPNQCIPTEHSCIGHRIWDTAPCFRVSNLSVDLMKSFTSADFVGLPSFVPLRHPCKQSGIKNNTASFQKAKVLARTIGFTVSEFLARLGTPNVLRFIHLTISAGVTSRNPASVYSRFYGCTCPFSKQWTLAIRLWRILLYRFVLLAILEQSGTAVLTNKNTKE